MPGGPPGRILFGAILYAAVQGMIILANPLQPAFETLTPADQELPLVPLAEVYHALILLVAVIGLAYIGLGLSIARRYVDIGPRWATAWFVPVATIFGTVVGVLAGPGPVRRHVRCRRRSLIYVASSVDPRRHADRRVATNDTSMPSFGSV